MILKRMASNGEKSTNTIEFEDLGEATQFLVALLPLEGNYTHHGTTEWFGNCSLVYSHGIFTLEYDRIRGDNEVEHIKFQYILE